jgi:hypothetical protein
MCNLSIDDYIMLEDSNSYFLGRKSANFRYLKNLNKKRYNLYGIKIITEYKQYPSWLTGIRLIPPENKAIKLNFSNEYEINNQHFVHPELESHDNQANNDLHLQFKVIRDKYLVSIKKRIEQAKKKSIQQIPVFVPDSQIPNNMKWFYDDTQIISKQDYLNIQNNNHTQLTQVENFNNILFSIKHFIFTGISIINIVSKKVESLPDKTVDKLSIVMPKLNK